LRSSAREAGFVQIAQLVIQVIEALLQPGVELFAEGEVALGEAILLSEARLAFLPPAGQAPPQA